MRCKAARLGAGRSAAGTPNTQRAVRCRPCDATRRGSAHSASAAPAATRPAIPKSIHEIDNGTILGFGADLDNDHVSFFRPPCAIPTPTC